MRRSYSNHIIYVLIYSMILLNSCKQRRVVDSQVSELPTRPSAFKTVSDAADPIQRRALTSLMNIFRHKSESLNLPIVVVNVGNGEIRKAEKEEVIGIKALEYGDELYFGSPLNRYAVGLQSIGRNKRDNTKLEMVFAKYDLKNLKSRNVSVDGRQRVTVDSSLTSEKLSSAITGEMNKLLSFLESSGIISSVTDAAKLRLVGVKEGVNKISKLLVSIFFIGIASVAFWFFTKKLDGNSRITIGILVFTAGMFVNSYLRSIVDDFVSEDSNLAQDKQVVIQYVNANGSDVQGNMGAPNQMSPSAQNPGSQIPSIKTINRQISMVSSTDISADFASANLKEQCSAPRYLDSNTVCMGKSGQMSCAAICVNPNIPAPENDIYGYSVAMVANDNEYQRDAFNMLDLNTACREWAGTNEFHLYRVKNIGSYARAGICKY